ncbi:MAG: HD domain-containing protein, partial [Bacilli bacterium]|nr:HD domain-containing protein [Bacilli bacterium]
MLTELMMFAMMLHVIFYSGFTKVQKFWYLATFISIMLCAFAEFCVHCGYYKPSFKIPLTILTVLQFSIAPLLGVFFTGALGLHKEAKFASIIFSLNFLVEVSLAPFGLVFYFNEEGYFRGDLFYIYEIMFFLSLAYLIVSMIIAGKRFLHRDFWTIVMVLIILVSGIVPMIIFHLNITYIAIAISASLCYIYYNDLVQQDIKADYIANQEKITRMQEHIISGLSNLIENRDLETGEHITRTSTYVKIIAQAAVKEGVYTDTINDHFITLLYTLAPMHDIGKIIVSDNILKKPGRLTIDEFDLMKKHAEVGGTVVKEVLSGITDEEYLEFASDIATYHHEWW